MSSHSCSFAFIIFCSGMSGAIPSGIVAQATTALPNSPDSTTAAAAKTGPIKKKSRRGRKAKETLPPPVQSSCSKPQTGELAPLPEGKFVSEMFKMF